MTDITGSTTTVVASMLYLGLGTLVELKYEAASNLKLTYEQGGTGTAGDKYKGLDRFGRIVETVWIKGFGDVVQSLYGHNRASSILWRKDEEASNTIAMDAYYEYDDLQQVTEWKRGNLAPSSGPPFTGVSSQKQGENFTYDQTGNWLGDVSDTPTFTQSRTHNVNNQITSITGPTGVIQPAYDAAGNMTLAPSPAASATGYAYKWDAWNRLIEIKRSDTDAVVGAYAYDALTRRTRKTVGGVTRDIYYDRQWRSIEEREGGTVKAQHTWSLLDRWTLIRRKRSVSGTLDESLFCLRDYLDPVALANISGNVVERYSYDAFGTVQIMDAAFAVRSSSAYDWEFLYHGEFRDKESELYNYGYRYLDTQLGRWLSRDPIGEEGGDNLYAFLRNGGPATSDYFGLAKCCCAESIEFVPGNRRHPGVTEEDARKIDKEGGMSDEGAFDTPQRFGHAFNVKILMSYKDSKTNQPCKYSWSERTNLPAYQWQKPNEWTNMFDQKHPARPAIPEGITKMETVAMDFDTPSLLKTRVGRSRKLEISITLESGSSTCEKKAVKASVTQDLTYDDKGRITEQKITYTPKPK